MKKEISFKGLVLATAAAGIFATAGCAMTEQNHHMNTAGGVKCTGVNSCKGKSACKSTTNNCKGQNSCKGSGFEMKDSAAACKTAFDSMWGGPHGTKVPYKP
ncbi:MAG: hypothetical protein ABIR48_00410 [Gammaproteobacteria bacterium]